MNSNDVEIFKPLSKLLKIIIKGVDVCSFKTFYISDTCIFFSYPYLLSMYICIYDFVPHVTVIWSLSE